MIKQTNPAFTPSASEKEYLEGSGPSRGCVLRAAAKLSRPVDGAALQRAADHALGRYPQISVGIAQDKNNYFFIPIDLPAPVFEYGDTVRRMGTDDTNAYLFCISCEGNAIYADWLRALADEASFAGFLETVLDCYWEEAGLPAESGVQFEGVPENF